MTLKSYFWPFSSYDWLAFGVFVKSLISKWNRRQKPTSFKGVAAAKASTTKKKKKREKKKNAPARRSLAKMNRMESNEIFDWASEENLGKWRGLFVTPLKKVLQQVHPQFTAKEDALDYVENLLFRLLAMLTAKPAPLSTSDVEVKALNSLKKEPLFHLTLLYRNECQIDFQIP